jgi:hypothetical protein
MTELAQALGSALRDSGAHGRVPKAAFQSALRRILSEIKQYVVIVTT